MLRAIIALILVLGLLAGGGYMAVRQLLPRAEPADQGPVYATVPVERGDVEVVVEGFGNLDPMFYSHIQTPATGTVEQVLVEQGQRVRRGDLIAVIRNDQLGFEVQQKRLELQRMREELAQLLGVPPEQVTQVPAGTELVLRAPISGRVVDLQAPGPDQRLQPIQAGMEIAENQRVATIVDDSRVVVVAELFAGEVARVETGQEVSMAVEGFDGFTPGRVADVNRNPVPAGDTFVYRVTVEAPNPGLLRPGLTVNLTFHTPQGDLQVPRPFQIDRYGRQTSVYSGGKGTVVRVHVREGAQVRAGDPILTLGGQLSAEFIRAKQAQIRQAELELAQKQALVENLEVRSPIDGVVAWLNVQPGMAIRDAGWGIAAIFDSRQMRIFMRVDELDVIYLREGMEATVTVEARPGKSWKARIERVDQMGTNEQGIAQYGVLLQVDGTDDLRPGMSATVRIPVGVARGVLRVPVEAVFDEDGGHAVEVLVDGRPQLVKVELGLVNDRWAEVKSGLREGQQVIVGSSLERLEGVGAPGTALPLPGAGGGQGGGEGGDGGGGGGAAAPAKPVPVPPPAEGPEGKEGK